MTKKQSLRNVERSSRGTIIDLLMRCDEGAYANDLVPARLSRSQFSPQDRALITKVVYSTLRQQIRLDFAIAKLSKRPFSSLDPIVISALRSVASQLVDGFDMHGVVNETVKVLPFSMKGFVNALSRKMIDAHKNNKLFEGESEAVASAFPPWIYNEIKSTFDQTTNDVVAALNSSATVTLAPLGQDLALGEAGNLIGGARLISGMGDISQLDVMKEGKAIVADQGSQLVAQCVDPQPQDVVLDLCCAPGGKTFLIAEKAKHVIANDVSESRMEKVAHTLDRIHADNVTTNISDARTYQFTQRIDRMLIDAPCSGLGVLRRRPDARHRITTDRVDELVHLQKEILSAAISQMTSGTKLIYSVCTFTEAETIEVDRWLETKFPELVPEKINFEHVLFNQHGRGYLLTPTAENDSMYILRLTKT
jgi:16S rRNA (cytosine967-C5)-methyltransferase